MLKNISVENHGYQVEYPDKCPICHHHGEISVIKTHQEPNNTGVQVVFQCAYSGCKSFFIGYYPPKGQKELKTLKPQKPETTTFPDTLKELSPSFVSIYEEADEALHLGLKQIAGPGYRKAFEYLIKDYAKSLKPEDSSNIEKMFSGNVVKEFIADPRIQAVAKRALWLGNDETHYLKKWTQHDVGDLITLIKLAINWIEIERLSQAYTKEMPD
jgi:hypothetical protein